ncbi:hypothetical protein, partial [Legionella tunisiensis]|uniref:hypothetical protein n=1 Tax=Legionella tunisiensis TaxID=1034944 RepID=UPI0012EAEB8A
MQKIVDSLDLEDPNIFRMAWLESLFDQLNSELKFRSIDHEVSQFLAKDVVDLICSNIFHMEWGLDIDFGRLNIVDDETGIANDITDAMVSILEIIKESKNRSNQNGDVDWVETLIN